MHFFPKKQLCQRRAGLLEPEEGGLGWHVPTPTGSPPIFKEDQSTPRGGGRLCPPHYYVTSPPWIFKPSYAPEGPDI